MRRLAFAVGLAVVALVLAARSDSSLAQTGPDLMPTAFTAPAAADIPAAGVRVQVSWTVTNQGGATTAGWIDRIWLSTDQVLNSGDTSVHAVFHGGGLAAGGSYPVNAEFNLPRPAGLNVSGAPPTDYYLLLRADDNGSATSTSGGSVAEADEANNIFVHTIRLTPLYPDLVPTAFTAPAAADIPAAGARVRVSWTVANQGPDLAQCCWTDRIWLSTNQTLESGDTHLHAINRGAELPPADPTSDADAYTVRSFDVFIPRPAALNNPATPAPARYFLLMRTDDFGNPASAGPHAVVEGSDLNNVAIAPIDLTPVFPDLAPTAFTAPAAADVPATGAQVRVTWTVTNQGSDVAVPVWSDRIWFSNNDTLGSGDTQLRVVNRNVELPANDPNSDDDTYTVTGLVTVPRPSPLNSPTAPPTDFFLLVRTDDFGSPTSTGPHAVVESDETDNVAVARIRLTPVFPDLAPTAFTAPAAADIPAGGARIRVSWTVTNQGPDVARCCWNDRVWLSTDRALDGGDTHVQFFTRPDDLAARDPNSDDDTYTVTAFVTVPRPTALNTPIPTARYFLLLRTDDTGNATVVGPHSVVEGDDTNNLAVASIDLTPVFPDLVTTTVTAPSSAVAGQRISVRWTVANQGPDAARSGWNDRIWLSNDRVLGSGDIHLGALSQNADIPAGESYDQTLFVTIPAGHATGTYHLFVRADDNGNPASNAAASVIESSDSNNARSVRITVGHQAPTADAGGPYGVAEGGTVGLTGNGSDPDNDPLSFAWDLDSNGSFETSGRTPTFSAAGLDGPGNRSVAIEVCDNRNACTTASATVEITNVAPEVEAAAAPDSIDEGSSLTVSATVTDPGGANDPPTFEFDCDGDGTYEVGGQPQDSTSCAYNDNGGFQPSVRVADGDNGADADAVAVTVANVGPTAILSNNGPVNLGSPATISFGGQTDPSSADTEAGFHYAFACDNGSLAGATYADSGAGSSTTCTFTDAPGVHKVRARIIDKNDGFTEQTTDVRVDDPTPPTTPTLRLAENPADPDQHVAGTTFYYRPTGDGGRFDVTAGTNDPESPTNLSVAFPGVFGGAPPPDATAPFAHTYTWSSGATAAGSFPVTATSAGGTSVPAPFNVVIDTRKPTVKISSPTVDRATGAATLPPGRASEIKATARDTGSKLAKVEFRFCTDRICAWDAATPIGGADTTAPYAVSWTPPSSGTFFLLTRATDNVGNVGNARAVKVIVPAATRTAAAAAETADTTAPTVTLTVPEAGSPLSGTVALAAEAADDGSGVAEVTFQVRPAAGGKWTTLARVGRAPYERRVDVGGLADGRYVLRAVAADEASNVAASAPVRVTVVSAAPTARDDATLAPNPATTTEERARKET